MIENRKSSMKNFLDMKDDSLLLPIRFEVHFEIVLIDEMEELEGLFKVEMSYTFFTSVNYSLEMGWRCIGNGLVIVVVLMIPLPRQDWR